MTNHQASEKYLKKKKQKKKEEEREKRTDFFMWNAECGKIQKELFFFLFYKRMAAAVVRDRAAGKKKADVKLIQI